MGKGLFRSLGHIMRIGDLEDLTLTGRTDVNRGWGKQQVAYISCLGKWVTEHELW